MVRGIAGAALQATQRLLGRPERQRGYAKCGAILP